MLRAHCAASDWTGPNDPVFASGSGGPIDRDNVRRRYLQRAAEEVGVTAGSATSATRARRASSALAATRFRSSAGHHSPSFTLATYVHVMDDELGEPLALPVVGALPEASATLV